MVSLFISIISYLYLLIFWNRKLLGKLQLISYQFEQISIGMNKQARKKIFFGSNQVSEKRYEFKLSWGLAPHPQKVWKGGQDALFVSKNVLIVADGVGGWSKLGIDSGVYARKLISIAKQLLQSEKQLYYIDHPSVLAAEVVKQNNQKGSSTLTIVTLNPHNGLLRSYYIGDSVFGLFSPSGENLIFEEQQKEFNVPFQVFGGENNSKGDSDSEDQKPISDVFSGIYNQFSFAQVSDKTILMASDGLWDNLPTQQIHKILFNGGDLISKTKTLVKKAKQFSFLTQFQSPFYIKAQKQDHSVPKCGKVDDISIILAEASMLQTPLL